MCWRRLLRVPWTARRSNQPILKEIRPEYSLERLMLKLKLQYFGHLMWRTDIRKDADAGKDWRWEEKGTIRGWDGWMVSPIRWTWVWASSGGWWWTCCSPWGRKELGTTEWLNWTEFNSFLFHRDCWLLVEVLVLVCRCKLHNTVSWAQSMSLNGWKHPCSMS